MGRMLIYLVVGMGIIASYATLQLNRSNLNANENAAENYEITQARNLAKSGVEYAISRLAEDTTWSAGYTSNNISFGTLTVDIQRTKAMYPGGADMNLANARLIRAVGTVASQQISIQAVVEIPTTDSWPPGLGYGILSDKDFELGGNVLVRDHFNPAWNASIHTNQDLDFHGSNTVTGYGTYSGNVLGSAADAIATFTPNVDKGGDVVHLSPPVDIPDIDPSKWESIATRKFYSNQKFSGTTTLGTKENPEIWYIHGDLSITGQVEGYGVFLVTGDLKITGNTEVTALDPSGNNLGIIVAGDVKAAGTTAITATILSGGTFDALGTSTIIGSVIAKGAIKFGGTPNIYYRPMLTELSKKIWEPEPMRPRIVSYYE